MRMLNIGLGARGSGLGIGISGRLSNDPLGVQTAPASPISLS